MASVTIYKTNKSEKYITNIKYVKYVYYNALNISASS